MKDRGNWIKTFTGGKFYVLDPMPDEVHIEDIAHALSNQCRFGGHVKEFYSVAEHCYNVSVIAPKHFKLDGLLHDASEAYLVDIPKPIKRMVNLDGYRAIEAHVQQCVDWKYGTFHSNVKAQDNQMLAIEIGALMKNPEDYSVAPIFPRRNLNWCGNRSFDFPPDIHDFDVTIQCWSPKTAERYFLERFRKLQELQRDSGEAV